ncbi:MAG: hypothetical protein GJ676_01500 [Rhodobacteraceae bacterium]|nr:hypothetical protein [Paracoccaceae bacterium]
MTDFVATNAKSSGIQIDRKILKSLARRSDRPGLIYLAQWVGFLFATGVLIYLSLGTIWVWPAMLLYGIFLTVPAYSMSHETAHGTAFKTRWLNECVLWVTSLIYVEEPLHRRYTHTNHHTFTWHVGKDSQMPFDTPMTLIGWLHEITGFALARFHTQVLFQLALGRFSDIQNAVIPEQEKPKLVRNARIFLAIYAAIPVLAIFGIYAPIWFFVLPRLLGAPIMLLFTLIQHVEMQENSPSILDSTRSFRTNWLGRFLYMDMNNHVEHHLYPQIPFYSLRDLNGAVGDQLPEPDPGFWKTNLEVLDVVTRRSLGRNTKARSIRQAPHHVTDGQYEKIAKATM